MRKTMLMTVAALAAAELFAIQGTVSTAVESVSGDVKWHARDKKYIIEKGKITKEFKLADVTSLDIPKPAGFDKAVQAVENGQGASAVATLTKIVADYRPDAPGEAPTAPSAGAPQVSDGFLPV